MRVGIWARLCRQERLLLPPRTFRAAHSNWGVGGTG